MKKYSSLHLSQFRRIKVSTFINLTLLVFLRAFIINFVSILVFFFWSRLPHSEYIFYDIGTLQKYMKQAQRIPRLKTTICESHKVSYVEFEPTTLGAVEKYPLSQLCSREVKNCLYWKFLVTVIYNLFIIIILHMNHNPEQIIECFNQISVTKFTFV